MAHFWLLAVVLFTCSAFGAPVPSSTVATLVPSPTASLGPGGICVKSSKGSCAIQVIFEFIFPLSGLMMFVIPITLQVLKHNAKDIKRFFRNFADRVSSAALRVFHGIEDTYGFIVAVVEWTWCGIKAVAGLLRRLFKTRSPPHVASTDGVELLDQKDKDYKDKDKKAKGKDQGDNDAASCATPAPPYTRPPTYTTAPPTVTGGSSVGQYVTSSAATISTIAEEDEETDGLLPPGAARPLRPPPVRLSTIQEGDPVASSVVMMHLRREDSVV